VKRRDALLSVAGAALLAACQPAVKAHRDGPRLPWLPLTDYAGDPATLPPTSRAGRILNFWALWCGPCRYELPGLQRLAHDFAPRGIEVTTIALADNGFAVREYLAQHSLALPGALLHPGLPVTRELALDAVPQTFLLAADGTVLAVWVGARDWDAPEVRAQLAREMESA